MTAFEKKHLVIIDPREMDGNPFDVASRAAEQAAALIDLAAEQTALAALMARNSYMERELQEHRPLTPNAFEESAAGRRFVRDQEDLEDLAKSLRISAKAAGYDPKHPPKA